MENIKYTAIDLERNEEVLVHCPCEYGNGQIVTVKIGDSDTEKKFRILERIQKIPPTIVGGLFIVSATQVLTYHLFLHIFRCSEMRSIRSQL